MKNIIGSFVSMRRAELDVDDLCGGLAGTYYL